MLIYRAGGIKKARRERGTKAYRMLMDKDTDIPDEVMPYCNYGIEDGFNGYYANQEKKAQEQLSPRSQGLAIWADAEVITDQVVEQLPACTHRVI